MRRGFVFLFILAAGSAAAEPGPPVKAEKPATIEMFPGIVLDDSDAEYTGTWQVIQSENAIGKSSHHDGNRLKGQNSARFKVTLAEKGKYIVRMAYTPSGNRASNVPVTIEHADGSTTLAVDERIKPERHFVILGTFRFSPDKPAIITVGTAKTDGYVSIDGINFIPAHD